MNVRFGDSVVGEFSPTYFIAEAGINHNGSLDTALDLVDVAADSGCQAIKFQKRTPSISTPDSQKNVIRETPWGSMTYLDYKKRIEFGREEYSVIAKKAKERSISWFASPWDLPSVDFLEEMDVFSYKIASASVTDLELLKAIRSTGKPVFLSTGMSTLDEIDGAVSLLDEENLVLMHATSTYPLEPSEANLKMIDTLKTRYNVPVGYSGHEKGMQISLAAAALGARAIERHITLDRTMWGTDHSASLEPKALTTLVRDVRIIENALGDGIKTVYESELGPRDKLRRIK